MDAMLDAISRRTLSDIIIDHPPLEERKLPLGGDSASTQVQASVTIFLPSRIPFRVWTWMMDFLRRFAKGSWLHWRALRVIQAIFSIDSHVLAEIQELVKKCCIVENQFTFQIASWGIFYHNGDSLHFFRLKEGDVPVNIGAKCKYIDNGAIITLYGLHLNGAHKYYSKEFWTPIQGGFKHFDSALRGVRYPIVEELDFSIKKFEGVQESTIHATKAIDFDGISLVVRSDASYPETFLTRLYVEDELQMMTKPFWESIPDLIIKQQLLVEYWKGNKAIIQFQNLLVSQISTSNGARPLHFIIMSPSSTDRGYWQRALHDLSADHVSNGSNSKSSTIHSTKGRIKFMLGELESALLDFDYVANSNTKGLASNLFDRAMVKCALARYPEAMQDINKVVEINPNNSNIKRFRACIEDIVCMDFSKSLIPLLQPTLPMYNCKYDLLTGDHYPNLNSSRYYQKMPPTIKSTEEFGLSLTPDWTEVREPSKDLLSLDVQQGTFYNHDLLQLLLNYMTLYGLTEYDSFSIGEKLAEGGQAEIFKALGTHSSNTQKNPPLVLKVFKQAFPLQTWLQPDALQFGGVDVNSPSPFLCTALGVKFLKDGRCAFVFPGHWGDLHHLIHQQIVKHSPFEFSTSVKIMLQIAEGMWGLHIRNILHRDLKASNILVNGDNPTLEDFQCMIADFECSVGVAGTGFWRALEILIQLNDQTSEAKPLAWSKDADVYSFSMVCYEILIGCTPFKNLRASDCDVVLSGERPHLPELIDLRLRMLIEVCWHADPKKRLSFLEICKVLANMEGEYCLKDFEFKFSLA